MSGLPMNLRIRQREDERLEAAARMLAEEKKVTGVVFFEHRTDAMIKGRLVRERIAAKNKEVRARIDERRARLAALLESEKIELQRDIEATFESPEIVKERCVLARWTFDCPPTLTSLPSPHSPPPPRRMFAHARKLKEESEQRRRKLAEELENRRFRQSSDVLRARASAITAERVALDRIAQLQEKQKLAQLEAEREAEDAAAAAAASKGAMDEARVRAEARRRIALEYNTTLTQQLAAAQSIKASDGGVDNSEVERMLRADQAAAAAQRQAELDRRAAARAEYDRVQLYNASERGVKKKASDAEAAQDKASLEATLRREAEEAAAERAAALERRRAGMEFKQQLEKQMAVQAEDRGWVDKFYQEESEKEWTKRQQKWDAEAAARKALLDEVSTGRLAQMQDRSRQGDIERARDAAQLEAWARDRADADAKEAERAAARRQQLSLQAGYTRQQLEENARARDAAKQEEYLEWRLAQKFERDYESRVQALLAVRD
jgi:hypothetical protein